MIFAFLERIDANDKRLTAVEWKSGTNMRIIDIVAPFGGEAEMRGQLKRNDFRLIRFGIPKSGGL